MAGRQVEWRNVPLSPELRARISHYQEAYGRTFTEAAELAVHQERLKRYYEMVWAPRRAAERLEKERAEMSYRCESCGKAVPPGWPQKKFTTYRPDGQVAREVAVCDSCHRRLMDGDTVEQIRADNCFVPAAPLPLNPTSVPEPAPPEPVVLGEGLVLSEPEFSKYPAKKKSRKPKAPRAAKKLSETDAALAVKPVRRKPSK